MKIANEKTHVILGKDYLKFTLLKETKIITHVLYIHGLKHNLFFGTIPHARLIDYML
jgi:hypothetical protein